MLIQILVALFIFTSPGFSQDLQSTPTCDELADTLQQQQTLLQENPESSDASRTYVELMKKYVTACYPNHYEPDSIYKENMKKYLSSMINNSPEQDSTYQKNLKKYLGF